MPEIDPRVTRDIEQYGFHVVKVMEDDVGPAHAFTVGLNKSHDHPEIVAVGPDLDVLHQLVNAVGADVGEGRRFEAEQAYEGIVQGMKCHFREVHLANYGDFLGYAGWYYEGKPFPALQCLWPDPNGHFPFEDTFHKELRGLQPDLGVPFRAPPPPPPR